MSAGWEKMFPLAILRDLGLLTCSDILLNISCIAVVFPMKVAAMARPRGATEQTAVFTLLGIHSTKWLEMKEKPQFLSYKFRYVPYLLLCR